MESAQPVFTVRSVEDAIGWYRDVLGFEVEFVHEGPNHPPNYTVLRKRQRRAPSRPGGRHGEPGGAGRLQLRHP